MSSRRPGGGGGTEGGRRRRDTPGNYYQGKERTWGQATTSFYVSNLLEGTITADLKTCFGDYGKVVDAYVAAKKDKAGYLFGFFRFDGVKDKVGMEAQLSSVNLNNARLSVNLAKYDKGGKPKRAEGSRTNIQPPCPQQEDRFEWVPDWIGRPEKNQPSARCPAAQSPVMGTHSNSNVVETEEVELHGDGACMGKGLGNDSNCGPKKVPHRFKFVAEKRSCPLAHQGSSNMGEIVQKLNDAIGLKSRKRPRMRVMDLDHIIGEANPVAPLIRRRSLGIGFRRGLSSLTLTHPWVEAYVMRQTLVAILRCPMAAKYPQWRWAEPNMLKMWCRRQSKLGKNCE
ncbi:hypothetical protein L1987_05984 [Smallanthus sonchifolius]|uniref:Uncharacterized protein n=1 Tax=Smallanthus sonchifolius TaxID=185202 RepID=A0ACB9JX97_9ASTR|nr:hypothetical protein L1987_05984 [Smallanthus sonchifolius]